MTFFKNKTIIHTIFPKATSLYSFLTKKCEIPSKVLKVNSNENYISLLNDSLIYVSENETRYIPKYKAFMPSPAFSFNEVIFFNNCFYIFFY